MKLDAQLDHAAEDLLRVLGALPEVQRVMRQCLPAPSGSQASYHAGRRGSVIWCDLHERQVDACHRDDLACRGTPLLALSDPTGDAAVGARVWEDTREANRRARRIMGDADWLVGMVNRWRDSDITPAREKQLEADNEPKCERHLRYGYDEKARSRKGSRVRRKNGTYVFTETHRLCGWCEKVARDFGRLATDQEIHANAKGKRLMRPAS